MPEQTTPDLIDLGHAAKGVNTATGVEAEARSGAQDERLKGADHGSTLEIAGGEPQPDFKGAKDPVGLQAEAATFASNGSLEPNMLPSTSGPQPAAATIHDPEAAQAALDQHQDEQFDTLKARFENRSEIPEETISRMSSAELRAVATDRGYTEVSDIQGRKSARSAFLKAQSEDKTVTKAKK